MSTGAISASPDALWWDTISGPSRFIREITSALRGGKHVCLFSRGGLPWHTAFLNRVREALLEAERDIQFIDDLEYGDDDMPDEALVRYFRLETMYRASKTRAEFLNERRALKDHIVYAQAQEHEIERWVKLMRAYSTNSVRDGLLLLDARSARPPTGAKNVKLMEYESYVTEYDALLFAGLLSDGAVNDEYKRYSAAVTVSLLGIDVERSSQSAGGGAMQDPLERLLPLLGDDYPADELARRLWSAQAQTLFPLIMQEWRRFTDTWRMEIEDGFDFASRFLPHGVQGSDGETVRSPDDMELANVIYLSRHRRYDDSGLQIVHIPDAAAMERVELLYDMRNQIAHGKVCKYEDVFKLINAAK